MAASPNDERTVVSVGGALLFAFASPAVQHPGTLAGATGGPSGTPAHPPVRRLRPKPPYHGADVFGPVGRTPVRHLLTPCGAVR
ncbi:hypothetical protein SCANM63S_06462 [Streptomyces canarius]